MRPIALLATIAVLAACEGRGPETRKVATKMIPPPAPAEIPEAMRSFCRPAGQGRADAPPPGAAAVPVRAVDVRDTRLEVAMDCIVRTPEEWAALVSTGQPGEVPAVAPVRFDREAVLVSTKGVQGSVTGHSIDIDTVAVSGGTMIVVVHPRWPEDNGPGLAMLGYPSAAVAVPAPVDSVVFLRRP